MLLINTVIHSGPELPILARLVFGVLAFVSFGGVVLLMAYIFIWNFGRKPAKAKGSEIYPINPVFPERDVFGLVKQTQTPAYIPEHSAGKRGATGFFVVLIVLGVLAYGLQHFQQRVPGRSFSASGWNGGGQTIVKQAEPPRVFPF